MKINTTSLDKQIYLQILENIAKPPQKLHYMGNLPASRIPTVAIVGTRKPTHYGKEVTAKLAYNLAQRGVVVISGLALGVDGIAHRSALEAGGTTLAVLGTGLPRIYPSAHQQLAKEILEKGGALMSEYDENEMARPYHFLQRNRIVSGLADALVVTEASARSGTLNTAGHALEQGKAVFAVPGNITSPMSLGCNSLIRQGATPLLHSDDVLEAIAPALLTPQASFALGANELEQRIINVLQSGVGDGDTIQIQLKISATELSTALTMLEINGVIRGLGANQWTLR